jgi:hypothetical protein
MGEDQYDFSGRKINTDDTSAIFDSTKFGTKYATATAGLSPLSEDYTPLFKDVAGGKSPFADFLSKPMGFSSENAMQADNAQNVAQAGKSESGGLMDLYSSLLGLLGGKGRAEDVGAKWKLSASGVPYRVVDMSAKDHRDISGNIVKDAPEEGFKMRSGIDNRLIDQQKQDTRQSWEKTNINPYFPTAPISNPMQSAFSQTPKTSEAFSKIRKPGEMIA